MILPEIREISLIVDAVRGYAVASARACCEERLTDSYQAPSLSSWDACMWFDLLQNWELSCFPVSGTDTSKRLLGSLQACLEWYRQREIDEHLRRLSVLSMIN